MKPHAIAIAVLVAIPLLLVGYIVSYFALLTPIFQGPIGYPHYRLGGGVTLYGFMPLHRLDRRVRREYWGTLPND